MATFGKSTGTLLTLQSVSASGSATSSPLDVSTAMGGLVYVRFGRRSATAAGAGVNFRMEASHATSGDNSWYPYAGSVSAFAACEAEAVTSASSGSNVLSVASTTNLTAGDIIFIDNGTIANSEWGRIKSIVANTSVTIEDNLVNTQTGATLYDSAEIYNTFEIPAGAVRIRLVADGSLFTQAFAVEAHYSLITGIA